MVTAATGRSSDRARAIAAIDALVDNFQAGDLVTIREHTESWRVLHKLDPRGRPAAGQTVVCVPLVVCDPVPPGSLADRPLWVEPRDLTLVTREAEQPDTEAA